MLVVSSEYAVNWFESSEVRKHSPSWPCFAQSLHKDIVKRVLLLQCSGVWHGYRLPEEVILAAEIAHMIFLVSYNVREGGLS